MSVRPYDSHGRDERQHSDPTTGILQLGRCSRWITWAGTGQQLGFAALGLVAALSLVVALRLLLVLLLPVTLVLVVVAIAPPGCPCLPRISGTTTAPRLSLLSDETHSRMVKIFDSVIRTSLSLSPPPKKCENLESFSAAHATILLNGRLALT